MASKPRTRMKSHEPKRFRLGGFDYFPDINSHGVVYHFQLIHQRDVYTAKDILEKLGGLGGPTATDRNDPFDSAAVNRNRLFTASRREATHNFRDQANFTIRVARVLSLRGEREMKVNASLHIGMLLKDLPQIFI